MLCNPGSFAGLLLHDSAFSQAKPLARQTISDKTYLGLVHFHAQAPRLSKNCRLIQKEDELQGEKGLEKGASPLFHLK